MARSKSAPPTLEPKGGQINFRVGPDEKRLFTEQARRDGYKLSDWLRRLAHRRIDNPSGEV